MVTEMTSRERLLAAAKHEETDRVPIVPRYHNYCIEKYGDHLVENQLKINDEFGWDNYIAVPSLTDSLWPNYFWNVRIKDFSPLKKVGVEMEIMRKEETDYWLLDRTFSTPAGKLNDKIKIPKPNYGYGIRPNAHYLEFLIKEKSDLERIKYLLLGPAKFSDFDTLHMAQQLVGNKGIIMPYINAALDDKAGCVYGNENLMMIYFDDKDFCRELLDIFHEHTKREIKSLLERGVDGIHTTWYWSSPSAGWSPAMIEELFLPMAEELIKLVHSYDKIFYYYDDGNLMPIAIRLKEIGIDILGTCASPPAAENDIAELKKEIGDMVCLHGNTDVIDLMLKGSPDMIRDNVRQIIRVAGPGGGFIIGTSDSVREGTPEKNVRAWSDAAQEFGKYPILV